MGLPVRGKREEEFIRVNKQSEQGQKLSKSRFQASISKQFYANFKEFVLLLNYKLSASIFF